MQIRFLTSPEIIVSYSARACRSLAVSLSSRLPGSEVVAIGSEKMEGYMTMEEDEDGISFVKNSNPLHYLIKYNGKYIDIYGVYRNKKAVIDHYNDFYRNYLADAVDRIDMKFWPNEAKGVEEHRCDEKIPIDLLEFIVKHVDSQGFAVYNQITEYEFARSLQVVFNAKTYKLGDTIVSKIGNNYVTITGTIHSKLNIIPIQLDVEISDDAMKAVYCIPMNFFNKEEVFQPWFHQPWTNVASAECPVEQGQDWNAPVNILSRLSENNRTYPSMLTQDELDKINESLSEYVGVESHYCYDNYYYLLRNPTYRELLKDTEFKDKERIYVKSLILNSRVPLTYYDDVLNGNIRARLNCNILETDEWKVEKFDRLGHYFKYYLDKGQSIDKTAKWYSKWLKETLKRLNIDNQFLLGITNLYTLTYQDGKVGFRDYSKSIMYSPDFYVGIGHRENDIVEYIRDNLGEEYVEMLAEMRYVEVDMACYWHLVKNFE